MVTFIAALSSVLLGFLTPRWYVIAQVVLQVAGWQLLRGTWGWSMWFIHHGEEQPPTWFTRVELGLRCLVALSLPWVETLVVKLLFPQLAASQPFTSWQPVEAILYALGLALLHLLLLGLLLLLAEVVASLLARRE